MAYMSAGRSHFLQAGGESRSRAAGLDPRGGDIQAPLINNTNNNNINNIILLLLFRHPYFLKGDQFSDNTYNIGTDHKVCSSHLEI